MDLRQTAINTLSYQRDRVPKLRPPAGRHRGSEPRCANVHAAPGPAAGPQTNGRQGWSAPTAKTGFVDAEPTPSRFPADRRGDQDVVGSHRVTTFFSLRLRVAQHFTLQIGSRKMTSVSSSNPARVRVLQAGLRDHRSGVSGHRVQVARECRLAAWSLTASAVVGQQ